MQKLRLYGHFPLVCLRYWMFNTTQSPGVNGISEFAFKGDVGAYGYITCNAHAKIGEDKFQRTIIIII